MWSVIVTSKARKQIKRLPKEYATRIIATLRQMRHGPLSGDVAQIGLSNWRKRVGDYRIFMEVIKEQKLIYIFAVKRRTSTTYS